MGLHFSVAMAVVSSVGLLLLAAGESQAMHGKNNKNEQRRAKMTGISQDQTSISMFLF
jgi:hypothetical protein